MKNLTTLFAALAFASSAMAISWTSSPPSSVLAGQSYSLGASHTQTATTVVVFIYKNGAQYNSGGAGGTGLYPVTASASCSSSDSGGQTISWSAEGWSTAYPGWGMNGSVSGSTSVIANRSPSASISGSTSLTIGQTGSWSFGASDPDGNLYRWRFHSSSNPNPQWSSASGSSVSGSHSTSFSSPGTYGWVVDVEDTGGASDSSSISVSVSALPASFSFSGGPNFTYDGGAKSVSTTPSPSGATYSTGGTYSATNVGSYTATASATGNYSGSGSYNWNIAPKSASFSFSGGPFTYDGSAKSVSVSASPSGATYSTSGTSATNAGSYTATASANGNYSGSGSYDWTINPKPISAFSFSGGPSFTYDGGSKSVSVSVTPSGATYATSGTWSASAVGNYTATVTGTGNYTGSSSYNWSIDAAPPPVASFTFSGGPSFTYDGSAKSVAVSVSPAGAPYTTSGTYSAVNVGNYTAYATASGGYTGSGSKAWEIKPATASFTFSGGPSFGYDGTGKSVSVAASPAGATYSTSGTWSASAVGTYTATVTATGNYTGSQSFSWSIVSQTPAITAHPQNKEALQGETVTFAVTATGPNLNYQWHKNGSNIAGATSSTITLPNVVLADNGNYNVTVSNNYGGVTSQPASLTVNEPPIVLGLSVNVVSASEIQMTAQARDTKGDLHNFKFFVSPPPSYDGWNYVEAETVAPAYDLTLTDVWRPYTPLPNGTYYVWVRVWDGANQIDSNGGAFTSFTIGAGSPISLSVSPYEVANGDDLSVTYSGAGANSWIGLYNYYGSDANPILQQTVSGSGGLVTFNINSNFQLMERYNARMFLGSGSSNRMCISNSFLMVQAWGVTVVDGTGGASAVRAGTVLTITANPAPAGEVFVGWAIVEGPGVLGDAQHDPQASPTTFTVGEGYAIVRANYSGIPQISSPLTATGDFGRAFTYTLTASNSPTNFTATNLPAGLSLQILNNPTRAVISGTPTEFGTFNVPVSASNAAGSGNGLLRLEIRGSNADADGDGIPNGWELAHGLNPDSPADALQDPDSDGLTNVAEYNLGYNPNSAETTFGAGVGNSQTVAWPAANTTKTEAVGSTNGALSVDGSGAATYTLPIYTPPGIAGVEPSLALRYSSNGPNGLLGVGWSLGGLSLITRGASSHELYPNADSLSDRADYDALDRFFLDGNRLEVVEGSYGADASEYRTSQETFSKVKFHTSSGVSWFEVWTKAGLRMEFGHSTDSRTGVDASNQAVWLLNRVEDRSGNYLTVTYSINDTSKDHYPYPKEISYTGRSGVNPFTVVRFTYKDRTDQLRLFQPAQGSIDVLHLVDKIDVIYKTQAAAETVVRRYAMDYETSTYTARSRLHSVQETGLNGKQLPPTVFSWNTETGGYSNISVASLGSADDLIYVGEFDGDGKADYVQIGTRPARHAQIFLSNGDGFTASTEFDLNSDSGFIPTNDLINVCDLNGDGLTDFDVTFFRKDSYTQDTIRGNVWLASLSNGVVTVTSDGARSLVDTHTAALNVIYPRTVLVDAGGRGKAAILWVPADGNWHIIEWNDAGHAFSLVPNSYFAPSALLPENDIRPIELNGDGVTAFMVGNYGAGTQASPWKAAVVKRNGQDYRLYEMSTAFNSVDYKVHVGDFNGDGLSDFLVLQAASGGSRKVYAGAFSLSPVTLGFDLNFSESGDWYDQKITVGDFNGDGRDDLFLQRVSESQLWVATASTTSPVNFALAATVPNGPFKNEQVVPLDVNGDGRLDLFIRGDQSAGNSSTACRVLRANTSTAPSDVITSITNGLGATVGLVYAPLTDSSVYAKGGAATGMTNLQLPINVVKSLAFDLGKASILSGTDTFTDSNASYALTFKYDGLRAAPYRGILGFAVQEVTDSRTQLITRTERRQDYPYTGFVTRTKVYRKSGSTDIVLSDTTNVPGRLSLNSGATDYVYPASTLVEAWGINSAFDAQGAKISSVSATQSVDDYGNVTDIDVDHGFEGRGVTTSAEFWPADATQWLVGRVKKVTVTMTATGQPTDVRTMEVYYKDNDDLANEGVSPTLVTKTISEPLDAAKKLTTVYDYTDGAGHINKITTKGRKDATTDQSRIVEYVYDSLTRFVTDVNTTAPSSAGGLLTEIYQPDQVHGAPLSYTDANNLTTSFIYDDFCRLQKVTGPDHVAIESTLAWTTDARGVFSVGTTATFNDGSVKHVTPPSFAVFDRIGRPVRSGALNADGHPVWVETRYNDKGYANYVSQPWRQLPTNWDWTTAPDYTASGDPLRFWTRLTYDGLGRLWTRQNPNGSTISASYGDSETVVTAYMTYDSTSVTQKTRTLRDPLGRVINVYNNEGLGTATERDALGYVYNASGRLAQVTAAGVQTSMGYDNRGLPTSLADPNSGNRAYSFNAFGELYKVVDAKTQTTTFDYDVLGRAASRTASEGTTSWSYDTAPGKGKGLVYQVSGPDAAGGTVTETFEYHTGLSRVAKLTRQIAGTSFVERPGYDAASRLQTIQYESPSLTQQLKYAYSNLGSMREIRDMSAGLTGGITVWGLGEVNAYGQPMSEILGNGVRTTSLYSATDGILRMRIAKTDASLVEYRTFDVDGFGNVRKRELRNADGTVARTESYVVDLLNRVTTVKLDGVTTLSTEFDSQGNIKTKSDVGSYLYDDPDRPHAVTQAGSTTFAYDANGNRTQRNLTQEAWWSSFDQPTKLKRGAIESTFRYDAEGNRVQQSSTTGETTYYVDGLHEYVTKSSGNEGRFAVASPTGRLVQVTVGTTHDIKYFTGDHLGSIEGITDYRGRSLESLSYDAWGRRRNANWTAGTPTRTTTVNRGFTDHEMLDDQQLVNMNGRVYDPVIARFLGVDPIAGGGAQTYNGYSYVANNPVSAIDPSGFQTADLYSGGGGFNFNGVNFSNPGYGGGWNSSVGGSFMGGANITFSFTFKNGAGSAGGIAAAAQPGLRYLSSANGGALGYGIAAHGIGMTPVPYYQTSYGDVVPLVPANLTAEEIMRIRMDGLDGATVLRLIGNHNWRLLGLEPAQARAARITLVALQNKKGAAAMALYRVLPIFAPAALTAPTSFGRIYPEGMFTPSGLRPMSALEIDTEILVGIKNQAVLRHNTEPFQPWEANLLRRDPSALARIRGIRIDRFFKEGVVQHPRLQHLEVTPLFKNGPDVFNPDTLFYWDVTTPGKWPTHLEDYWLFGSGIPLLTK